MAASVDPCLSFGVRYCSAAPGGRWPATMCGRAMGGVQVLFLSLRSIPRIRRPSMRGQLSGSTRARMEAARGRRSIPGSRIWISVPLGWIPRIRRSSTPGQATGSSRAPMGAARGRRPIPDSPLRGSALSRSIPRIRRSSMSGPWARGCTRARTGVRRGWRPTPGWGTRGLGILRSTRRIPRSSMPGPIPGQVTPFPRVRTGAGRGRRSMPDSRQTPPSTLLRSIPQIRRWSMLRYTATGCFGARTAVAHGRLRMPASRTCISGLLRSPLRIRRSSIRGLSAAAFSGA